MAATRLIALHINKGKTVAQRTAPIIHRTKRKPTMENISAPMAVIREPAMRNSSSLSANTSISPDGIRPMM